MAQPTILPFPFDKLKKYTKKEADLLSMLTGYFPARGFEPLLTSRLTESFKKYLGSELIIQYESLYDAPFKQFIAGLPERFVCAAVSLTPLSRKVMIEIDPELAFALIDKILGGSGKTSLMNRPLTSLEEGILQFLVVKVLKELSTLMKGASYQLRFDKILTRTESLGLIEDKETSVVLLTFRLKFGPNDGYLRLCLPHPFLLDVFSGGEPVFDRSASDSRSFFDERSKNVESFKTIVWAEAGKVTLSASEIDNLERGDIILFDEAYPSYDKKHLSGNVRLRIGDVSNVGIDASVTEQPDTYQLKMERIIRE